MDSQQNGIILISFLLILFVVTLLLSFALQSSQLAWKMQNHVYLFKQRHLAAQMGLLRAEALLLEGERLSCITPTQSYDYYAQQSESWWRNSIACRYELGGFNIAVLAEQFAEEACVAAMDSNGNATDNVAYWRITARSWRENTGPLYLQSIVALGIEPLGDCDQLTGIIATGRQAWRKVSI